MKYSIGCQLLKQGYKKVASFPGTFKKHDLDLTRLREMGFKFASCTIWNENTKLWETYLKVVL